MTTCSVDIIYSSLLITRKGIVRPVHGKLWPAGSSSQLAWPQLRCHGKHAGPSVEPCYSPAKSKPKDATHFDWKKTPYSSNWFKSDHGLQKDEAMHPLPSSLQTPRNVHAYSSIWIQTVYNSCCYPHLFEEEVIGQVIQHHRVGTVNSICSGQQLDTILYGIRLTKCPHKTRLLKQTNKVFEALHFPFQ